MRYDYATLGERVGRLASALTALGVRPGDTVGVMDWDSHRYLECFFAVPMMGAVLHTVNIRLSPEQMLYTINHAEDDVILVNAEFLPLLEGDPREDPARRAASSLIDDGRRRRRRALAFAGEYEAMLDRALADIRVPGLRREHARHDVLHDRHDRTAEGRLLQPSPARAAHAGGGGQRSAQRAAQRRFHRGDVYMPITPMFHVHAWGFPYIATMLGVKQVYPGRYVPDVLLRLIAQRKA